MRLVDCDRHLQEINGAPNALGLKCDHAKQVQGVEIIRLVPKHVFIDRFRRCQVALLMLPKPLPQHRL
jgi:hypothetical protein